MHVDHAPKLFALANVLEDERPPRRLPLGGDLVVARRQPGQVGEVVLGVGKGRLDVYNFLLKINGKYDLTDKAGAQRKDQLNKLKAGSSGETIAKVEDALSKATSKFNELDKEYDLVEKGKQALGYAGDLSAKAIDKGLALNAEYKLTDQVVAKVTEAGSAAAAKATKKA